MKKKISNKIKKITVDIFALNSFLFLITIPNELFIAKLTVSQWLDIRFLGFIVNTITAKPYSSFREICFNITNTNFKSSKLKKYLVDTITFSIFQLPIYCLMLYVNNANLNQIIYASIPVILFSAFTGRPYGIYLEWLRKITKCN